MDNLFLQIARGEEPSHKVYEDDLVYAFLDIQPGTEGHTLIVPKEACSDIEELTPEVASALLMAAKKITKVLNELFDYDGVVLHQENGEKVQDVRHFHIHVYGGNKGEDKIYYKSFKNKEELNNSLASTAAKMREALIK